MRHTAADPGNLPDRPEADAVADRTAGPGADSHQAADRIPVEAAGRTDLPEVAVRTAAGLGARRTGLVEERRTDRPGVGRRNPAEGRRNPAEEGHRNHLGDRRSRLVRGWSSRPWSRMIGRWHRGGA